MGAIKVGFIGFGEVGSIFSRAMREAGAEVLVYDVLLDQGERAELLEERIREAGVQAVSLEQMIRNSDYILCTVTTRVAKDAASSCAPYLGPGQVYIDLNSTSPTIKVEVGDIIGPSGADFVEGAILGAVGATGARTRILTAGKKGESAAETLRGLGLNAAHYSPEIGKASTFKMLRSIFSKGLECLILELLVAGKRAGIDSDLWADISLFMAQNPFDRIASNWVCSHAVAHKRRYYEMLQVAETMREIGLEPVMTAGTIAFFERSLDLGLAEAFPSKPDTEDRVIDYLERRLRRG
jgi:3-hydroxyisobutyrate dehydrogenase-like beta-hydroxyacid dehydrogenase